MSIEDYSAANRDGNCVSLTLIDAGEQIDLKLEGFQIGVLKNSEFTYVERSMFIISAFADRLLSGQIPESMIDKLLDDFTDSFHNMISISNKELH